MTDVAVLDIAAKALLLALKLAGPLLLTSLAIGLIVGLVQSVVQLQEPTLAFVPKFVGSALVLLLSGAWMIDQAVGFTQDLFAMIPSLIRA